MVLSCPASAGRSVTELGFRYGRGWGEDETVGRRVGVVDSVVRARAGHRLGPVGAADVACVLAGRPDPGGADSRAATLGEYRVGAPLPFEELRSARSNSAEQ